MRRLAIFVWGIREWDAPTVGRSRYLCEGLAATGRDDIDVFFISPPPQPKFPLRHCEFWKAWRLARQRVEFQHNGVKVLRLFPCPLPYAHHFLPFRVARAAFLKQQLRRYVTKEHQNSILVVYDPKEWVLAKYWNGLSVYDCVDLMPSFKGAGRRVAQEEIRMIRSVSLVTCSSQGLLEHVRNLSPQISVTLVRNGVHWRRFQSSQPVHSSVAAIPRPRIGFIGSISYWVNLAMITELALQNPQWHFVFVGPQRQDIAALPNLHLLPPIPTEQVPGCIQGFDVGIIPFHDSPLVRCVNPLKLYEYLACGKPVVATPYGDFGEAEHLVYYAEKPHEFAEAIQRALQENTPELETERRQIAAQADWSNRAREFLRALGV